MFQFIVAVVRFRTFRSAKPVLSTGRAEASAATAAVSRLEVRGCDVVHDIQVPA